MLAFVYGTTGELIKIAPLIAWAEREGIPHRLWCTGQQIDELPAASTALGIRGPDRWLAAGWGGHSLRSKAELGKWLAKLQLDLVRCRRGLRRELDDRAIVIVHGDTITTVVGAQLGRMLRLPVAHVEAGLRSGTWRSPFPEELNRRIVTRLARVHFAPGAQPMDNLRKARARGVLVDTGLNTVFDAMELARHAPAAASDQLAPYGLVSIHRAELIESETNLRAVLEAVRDAAMSHHLVFIDHPVTAEAISRHRLEQLLNRVVRLPKQHYATFIRLVVRSEFVITDSGGLQEECGYLGHPCIVHREVTERDVGIGRSVVLTGGDVTQIAAFVAEAERYRFPPTIADRSPTTIIGDWLSAAGHTRGRQ